MAIKTTHEEHMKGGYFCRQCDKCALFLGKATMDGRIKFDNTADKTLPVKRE